MVVLFQVYEKFVLCKIVRLDKSELLVLVDQHAADERVKLENLFQIFFIRIGGNNLIVDVESLPFPIEVLLTRKEFDSLQEVQGHFQRWGIRWKSVTKELDGIGSHVADMCSIHLTHLPRSIASRCIHDFDTTRELVKRHIYWLEENRWAIHLQPFSCHRTWEQNLTGCPHGFIEVLNSRACRSAIMFNDILDEQKCRQLIDSLSKCANPFQCAHGRPTTAPIAIIQRK
ncbi:Vacuolar protein sorting-associated protein 11 [Basidiobolus ranarum]|uniref:Vacuolar protein sorting-associated protein 11 n=1 Tax=Basidiobolus ranarum TaxID=34480 RepID=A0ABR2WLG0_9FUNG